MNKRMQYRHTKDGIHTIQLAPPPDNLTDQLFFEELAAIVPQLYASGCCRGLIIRGGGGHFSDGADMAELIDVFGAEDMLTLEASTFRSIGVLQGVARLPVPAVAVIEGSCRSGGLELALSCRYRIGSKNATFCLPEADHRLLPGCGGAYLLTQAVGPAKSIELLLGGGTLSAREAKKIGLLDLIVEDDQLTATAEKIITQSGEVLP